MVRNPNFCFSVINMLFSKQPKWQNQVQDVALVVRRSKKKSITLKNCEARGFSEQLTRTEIAENQSLIKLVLVKVGAATALVDRSISSYGISSISSRRGRRIGGSSSISTYEQHTYECSGICTTLSNGGGKSVKLKNLSVTQTREFTHQSKSCTCRFFSPLPKHVRLSLFCCLAFLHLCCSKHSSRWATEACLYLPYSQTNLPNEAGDRFAEDSRKNQPKTWLAISGYVSLRSHGGRCFQ